MCSMVNAGVSRRSFMRILGAASAATTFPAFGAVQQAAGTAAQGQGRRGFGGGADMGDMRHLSPDTVIISSNENPLGPAQSALSAISTTAPLGGRYHLDETMKTIAVFNDLFPVEARLLCTVPRFERPSGPGVDVEHRAGQAAGLRRSQLRAGAARR